MKFRSIAWTLLISISAPPCLGAHARTTPTVHVERVEFTGNKVVPTRDLEQAVAEIMAHHPDHQLDADTIEEMRRAVTLVYVRGGYIASGAIVPKSAISSGVLTLQVIEGHVTRVNVTPVRGGEAGDPHPTVTDDTGLARYLCDRILSPPGSLGGLMALWRQEPTPVDLCGRPAQITENPLRMADLGLRVNELLRDPAIARVNVEVRPGAALGEATIDASVMENRGVVFHASVANDEPPDIGAIHGEVGGVARNLLFTGDALSLNYGRTQGANFASGRYEVPVTDVDTRLALFGAYNGAGVISQAFSGLGIRSVNQSAGVAAIQPLSTRETNDESTRTDTARSLTSFLSWDYTISDQSLLGQPFSFSAGYINGHAEAAALHAGLEWSLRTAVADIETQFIDLRGSINRGLDMFGTTNLPGTPNAGFTSLVGQAQYARAWDELSLFANASGQLSSQALYTFQQVAIGGPATVRGYVQNALVRDSGLIWSAELRRDVYKLPVPGLANDAKDGDVELCAFYDHGLGWNHGGPDQTPRGIASIGVGLRWDLTARISASVYYAYAMIRPHDVTTLLQPVSFGVKAEF